MLLQLRGGRVTLVLPALERWRNVGLGLSAPRACLWKPTKMRRALLRPRQLSGSCWGAETSVSVFLWELLSLKCALCGQEERERNGASEIFIWDRWPTTAKTGYNHHGNCPLWIKGELGRGSEDSRHEQRSQPCWGCLSDFCYSPGILKGCFRKNNYVKKKHNGHKNIIFLFCVLIWESALLIPEWKNMEILDNKHEKMSSQAKVLQTQKEGRGERACAAQLKGG